MAVSGQPVLTPARSTAPFDSVHCTPLPSVIALCGGIVVPDAVSFTPAAAFDVLLLLASVAVGELLRRIPSIRVAPDFEPEYVPLMTVTGLESLDVEWNSGGGIRC